MLDKYTKEQLQIIAGIRPGSEITNDHKEFIKTLVSSDSEPLYSYTDDYENPLIHPLNNISDQLLQIVKSYKELRVPNSNFNELLVQIEKHGNEIKELAQKNDFSKIFQ